QEVLLSKSLSAPENQRHAVRISRAAPQPCLLLPQALPGRAHPAERRSPPSQHGHLLPAGARRRQLHPNVSHADHAPAAHRTDRTQNCQPPSFMRCKPPAPTCVRPTSNRGFTRSSSTRATRPKASSIKPTSGTTKTSKKRRKKRSTRSNRKSARKRKRPPRKPASSPAGKRRKKSKPASA